MSAWLAVASLGWAASGQPAVEAWTPDERDIFALRERELLAVPTAESLMRLHQMLAEEPHIAGTEGDWRTIEEIAAFMRGLGLEVKIHEFWAYLPAQGPASLDIVSPDTVALPLQERALAEDPASAQGMPGWNAYSASGVAEGEVVYANYGTKEDFARLAELGVDCTGKVVLARYGGNYRGYKAKFAQAAGAAALVIYTDPADAGYTRGLVYPEGSFANDSCIQRGSINTLPYPGDPLTPGVEATEDAARLDPAEVDLPRIPVQPVGWAAAQPILERMRGGAVPEGWQGGLPLTYRVEGGPDLRVRVRVEQERAVRRSANVIGVLRGELDDVVVIGAHHDAWGFGASDPTCGTICVLESARSFAELATRGRRPHRTLAFAAWGAEEFGIIGSTEWVEANEDHLLDHAVAYINLDMAVMGPDFGSGASPMLRRVIADAAAAVPQARKPGVSVLEDWMRRSGASSPDALSFGDMGGGSDHIAFVNRVGVSSCSLNGSGAKGYSYHSAYDTLPWYWKTIGLDYEPAMMVTRMTTAVAARLADAPVIPLDPGLYGRDVRRHAGAISALGIASGGLSRGEGEIAVELLGLEAAAAQVEAAGARMRATIASAGAIEESTRDEINRILLNIDRLWLGDGLESRPWFRNVFIATDEDSGYAAWGLPQIRRCVERGADRDSLRAAIEQVEDVLAAIEKAIRTIERLALEG